MRQLSRSLLGLAIGFAMIAGSASLASAQNVTSGTFTGVVMDAQKAVLPGATVVAVHVPTGTSYEAVTQADGHFTIQSVRVGGPYTVKVSMSGFQEGQRTGIVVALGQSIDLEFTLNVAGVAETVNVTAEAQVIDTSRAGASSSVDNQTLENLPTIARSITDYARTSPYFVVNPVGSDAQSFSVAGRNDRYNNIQIDGAVNNDVFGLASSGTPGGQASAEPISLDALQELRLVVSAYDVRQGGFSGGSVNAITKSGTNNMHGTAYFYDRNQSLVGVGPNDRKFGTFANKQGGFSVGGPAVRNKAFYFGNVEFNRRDTPNGISVDGSGNRFNHVDEVNQFLDILKNTYGYNPGSTDEYTRKTDSDKIFVRGDVNLGGNHQLTVRHNYVSGVNDIAGGSVSAFRFADNFYRFNSKTNSTVGQLNSTFGRAFNEFRFGYQRIRENRSNPVDAAPFPQVTVYLPDRTTVRVGTEQYSAANALDQDIYELTDDLTLVHGKHTITIGTHNEFYRFRNVFIRDNFGTYSFDSLALFQQGLAQSYDYSYGSFDPNFAARFSVRQFGVYAGDQWRVRNNLTLNYGVRLDAPSFPDKPTANPVAIENFGYATNVAPASKMWSPRVGFNWKVREDSREQVRGGVGLFTGRTPYVWLSNQYGNTGIEISRLSVSYNRNNQIAFVANPDAQPTTVGRAQAGEIDMVDPNYTFPELIRGNIAYDRELGILGLVGSAELLFSKNVKDVKYENLNLKAAGIRPDGRQYDTFVNPALGPAIFLTNTDQGKQWSMAFKVQRPWKNGLTVSGSYMYNQATSITDGTSSQAASNWGYNYVPGDPNNPPLTTSTFDVRHRINLSGSYDIRIKRVVTTLSAFYNLQSGRPYALVFYNDVNGDTYRTNDLLYIPRDASEINVTNGTFDQLLTWLQADACATDYAGGIMPRNSCRQPWTNQLDFRLAFGVPIAGSRKVDVTLDVLNLMNMFNKDWGVVKYVSNNGNTDITYGGVSNDKMTYNLSYINSPTYQGRFLTDDVRSRWQAQLGVRFSF